MAKIIKSIEKKQKKTNKKTTKLSAKDINKNTGANISYTINKIKANEKKYTSILVIIFMTLICVIAFLTFRINSRYTNYLTDFHISDSSELIYLDESNKVNDIEGLKSRVYNISFSNLTDEELNYKIIYVEDNDSKIKCGCNYKELTKNDLKYSLDGKTIKKIQTDELVLTTGVLKRYESDNINIRLWIDENSDFIGHSHGYLTFEKIED